MKDFSYAILRFIYSGWQLIWRLLLVAGLSLILLVGGGLALLQIDKIRYIAVETAENAFNKTYNGHLELGKLNGFIPFQFRFENIILTYQQDQLASTDPVSDVKNDTLVALDSVAFGIDWSGLLRRKISLNYLKLSKPKLVLSRYDSTRYSLHRAFQRRSPLTEKPDTVNFFQKLKNFEILAPDVEIRNGFVSVDELQEKSQIFDLPQTLVVDSIQFKSFVEITERQRFVDIDHFNIKLPNLFIEHIRANGQIFNDDRYLEFNGFQLETALSQLNLTGEVDGFDAYQPHWSEQLSTAGYDLSLDSTVVYTSEMVDLLPRLPVYNQPFFLTADVEGDKNNLIFNQMNIGFNRSYLQFYGDLDGFAATDSLSYDITTTRYFIDRNDISTLLDKSLEPHPFFKMNEILGNARITGNKNQLQGRLLIRNEADSIHTEFAADFTDTLNYSAKILTNNFALGRFTAFTDSTTALTGRLRINGRGIQKEFARADISLTLDSSRINNRPIDYLNLDATLDNGFLETDLEIQNGEERLTAGGWLDILSRQPIIQLRGKGQNVNLENYFRYNEVPATVLNVEYSLQAQGITADEIYGNATLDVRKARINGQDVEPHNFQLEINKPSNTKRVLQFTSSIVDVRADGFIKTTDIAPLARKWSRFITSHIKEHILLNDSLKTPDLKIPKKVGTIQIALTGKSKNTRLLHHYFPTLPAINSSLSIEGDLNVDNSRLSASLAIREDSLAVNDVVMKGLKSAFEVDVFDPDLSRSQSSFTISNNISAINWNQTKIKGFNLDASLKNGSVALTQSTDQIGKKIRTEFNVISEFGKGFIRSRLQTFFVGTDTYNWINKETPVVTYLTNNRFGFEDFELINKDEFLKLEGTFSNISTDSLTLELGNIHLNRISGLVEWPFEFSGVINGNVFTKTLMRRPIVAGTISVKRLALDDRVVGDVAFNSQFNPEFERFDTKLSIVTDSTKYGAYLERNNGVGQRIFAEGFFYPPQQNKKQEKVYDFQVDIPEIDMWILPYIVQNVFESAEGVGSGSGWISGTLNDFDFNGQFNIDSVKVNTVFLNTNYTLKGGLRVDRHEGLNLDSIRVADDKKGRGTLYGNFDFNDFAQEKFFDLWLELRDLTFINIPFDRDTPFYGNSTGSGLVHLSGSNKAPLLTTVNPILVNTNSKIGIPLLEEITVNSNQDFIQFVDNFDNLRQKVRDRTVQTINISKNVEATSADDSEEQRDFTEFFDLNLQFTAPQPITGELIFDPLTNEMVTAKGIGSLQVILQDGEFSLFGNFEIQDGTYNFVSGDIIRRKFRLQKGGTLRWEGDPENARLNINAIYRARPDVSAIFNPGSDDRDLTDVQRIPVELILKISGTVESIENDFEFRVPNSLEATQGSRINDLEARLNQDDNRLLQAVSLLMTGELVPVTLSTDADATSALGSNFRNESGNVVLSPLLSNQISNLLNNNISNLDFDLNMAGFDQVDLGIALRLFNDRLILSREGQIGGTQNDIGNLGATYRLTQALSVIAFHRQDPTFGTLNSNDAGQSIQSLNGLGIEAQFDFNSWSGFSNSLKTTFRSVFGIARKEEKKSEQDKKDEDNNENITSKNE